MLELILRLQEKRNDGLVGLILDVVLMIDTPLLIIVLIK